MIRSERGDAALRIAAALIVTLMLGTVGVGCHPGRHRGRKAGTTTMDVFDDSANGQEVRVAAGGAFQVRLEENPTTGFRWEVVSDGAPVCQLAGDVFEGSDAAPGRPGRRTWTFKVVQGGDSIVELAARRPWEGAPPAKTFRLRVSASK